jgi:hypothetical protein
VMLDDLRVAALPEHRAAATQVWERHGHRVAASAGPPDRPAPSDVGLR